MRLEEDLLDHVGGEFLMVGGDTLGREPDDDSPEAAFASMEGACFGVLLRDAQSFGDSLEKLIRSRGMHAARKTEDYRGYQVRNLNFLGTPLYYVVSDKLCLVGMGATGGDELRAILDEENDRKNGVARGPFPEGVQERIDAVSGDWIGIGVNSVDDMIQQMLDTMRQTAREIGHVSWSEDAIDITEMLSQTIRKYDLDSYVTTLSIEENAMAGQMIW